MNNNDITVKLERENKEDRMTLQEFIDNPCKIDFFSNIQTYESYPYTVSDFGKIIPGKEKIIFSQWMDDDDNFPVHHKHPFSITSDDIYTIDEYHRLNDYLVETIKPFREKIIQFIKSGKFKEVIGQKPSDFYIKFCRSLNALQKEKDYFKTDYRLGILMTSTKSSPYFIPDYTIVFSEYKFTVRPYYFDFKCLYEENIKTI